MIGAVLCGGHSRRMGSPKALLPWGDGDLLGHALRRLRGAGMAAVCLGPERFAGRRGVAHLPDAVADAGPLGGVLAALRSDDAFVLAVDMPLLTAREIQALAASGMHAGALTLPVEEGELMALCGFWPRSLAGPLEEYLASGQRSVIGFAQGVEHCFLSSLQIEGLGIALEHLAGLNTPGEYAMALRSVGLPRRGRR